MTRDGRDTHILRVFLRGWLIVTLTALNVAMIARRHYGSAFLTGGAISYVWWGNAGHAADSRSASARLAYAAGAACGTVTGMALAAWMEGTQ